MRFQARVDDAFDLGMLLKKRRDRHCVCAMPLHPNGEGLDAAQGEESVEGTGYAADGVLQESELFFMNGLAQDSGAADHVGMPVQVLRGRVHHDVEAELQ